MSRLIFHVELGSIDRYEQKSDMATFTFADVHRCCYLGIRREGTEVEEVNPRWSLLHSPWGDMVTALN